MSTDSTIIIKSSDGAELYRAPAASVRAALIEAVSKKTTLRNADLRLVNLRGANLYGADLCRADLYGTNLQDADLGDADLRDANLYGANLRGTNLCGANLYGANLRGTLIVPEKVTPLLMLLDQPGKIRAYKLIKPNGEGPYNGGIIYEVGKSYEVADANCDVTEQCGAGINLATLDWCLREYQEGYKILIAEFTARDIAAIPTATDGKFRCHRVTIVGEVDLKARGIIE